MLSCFPPHARTTVLTSILNGCRESKSEKKERERERESKSEVDRETFLVVEFSRVFVVHIT